MINIKVTFMNGDSIATGFNGNLQDAQCYYLGHIFNVGNIEDNLQTAIKVELI